MSNSTADQDLTRRRVTASVLAILALLAVLAFTWWIDDQDGPDQAAPAPASTAAGALGAPPVHSTAVASSSRRAEPSSRAPRPSSAPRAAVPARVRATLEQIDAGRWPEAARAPGTRGGDIFRNREGRLPSRSASGTRITYKEWDVNPKRRGSGRDAERIVTGSDGAAWYTLDHYQSFTKIRGPSA